MTTQKQFVTLEEAKIAAKMLFWFSPIFWILFFIVMFVVDLGPFVMFIRWGFGFVAVYVILLMPCCISDLISYFRSYGKTVQTELDEAISSTKTLIEKIEEKIYGDIIEWMKNNNGE